MSPVRGAIIGELCRDDWEHMGIWFLKKMPMWTQGLDSELPMFWGIAVQCRGCQVLGVELFSFQLRGQDYKI